MQPWLDCNLLGRPGWPDGHWSTSASRVLGLGLWPAMPGLSTCNLESHPRDSLTLAGEQSGVVLWDLEER